MSEGVNPRASIGAVLPPVLTSKIVPVAPPAALVRRPRLESAFVSDADVISVCAPAGYGKTALVAGWFAAHETQSVAWVSLDPLDRNPLSFWRHVTAALAEECPGVAEAEAILVESGPGDLSFLAALAHGVLEASAQVWLVLDDLHVVDDEATGEALALLVERTKGSLRLVAMSRADPFLPLGRWRAEGRVVELREKELAFTVEEASMLLSAATPRLPDDTISELTAHTEGWAVGLLLARIAVGTDPGGPEELRGVLRSGRHLADYLISEVLVRLSPPVRRLALDLSVPPSFDEDMVVALTGQATDLATLRALLRSNPFVVSTPPGPTFRFHQLVRDLLRSELRWEDPQRFERLHRRAAEIMLERGRPDLTVALLLEIEDTDAAFDLIVRPALFLTDSGHLGQFARWFELLPELRPGDAGRAVELACALVLAGRAREADRWAVRAEELAGEDPDADIASRIDVTRLLTLGACGTCDEAATYIPRLERGGRFDRHDHAGIESRQSIQVIRVALEVDDLETAERWLRVAEDHPAPAVSAVAAPGLRACIGIERGDVRSALSDAQTSVAAAERLGLRPHHASFDGLVALHRAQVNLLHIEQAGETEALMVEDASVLGIPWALLRMWPSMAARLAITDGWTSVVEFLDSRRELLPPGGPSTLTVRHDELTVRALLGCGRVGEAAAIAYRLHRGRRRRLLEARAAVTARDVGEARQLLAARDGWRIPDRVEAELLWARTCPTGDEARHAVAEALRLVEKGGFAAHIVLEGDPIRELVDEVAEDELPTEIVRWRRRHLDLGARTRRRELGMIEPLTAKEQDVLTRLPTHLTYRAIGAELYVSVNTVKTYVSSIYRKLGVSSRADAVTVARAAGLLPDLAEAGT